MIKFLVLVVLLATVVSAGTLPKGIFRRLPSRLDGKIVNGEQSTIQMNPHQVSIRKWGSHFCGGSIISKHWVLTAAHCLYPPAKDYTVLAGTADKCDEKSTGSLHTADRMVIHPKFRHDKYGTLVDDVALLHVVEPFKFDGTRQPIELFNQDEEASAGSVSVITGWGSNGSYSPQILNLVEVPIISKTNCASLYQDRGGLYDGQICAAYDEGGKDACHGDSGGPLSINGRLAGIVSWGEGCALAGKPGVYTEVAHYRDWIQSVANV